MKTKQDQMPLPDMVSVSSEVKMGDKWDTQAVADLIRIKSEMGEAPAFLFLGNKEANLLRTHLAEAFGAASVITLHGMYYMCLEVIVIDCESFFRFGGRKTIRQSQAPYTLTPAWSNKDMDIVWKTRN